MAEKIEIAPGFNVWDIGLIDIGDIMVQIDHWDDKWEITQQLDHFTPDEPAKIKAGKFAIAGTLNTRHGPAHIEEQITVRRNEIQYWASFKSKTRIPTNELSVSFLLPDKSLAGKKVIVDRLVFTLPKDPAPKGVPRIRTLSEARHVELPLPTGRLIIEGTFGFLTQDDREWVFPHYRVRLQFSPCSGLIKRSEIAMRMRLEK